MKKINDLQVHCLYLTHGFKLADKLQKEHGLSDDAKYVMAALFMYFCFNYEHGKPSLRRMREFSRMTLAEPESIKRAVSELARKKLIYPAHECSLTRHDSIASLFEAVALSASEEWAKWKGSE